MVDTPLTSREIASGTRIGHVHLKVADLERALAFYCGVLGFKLMQRYGSEAAFVSAGGYHHHIGLNTWESRGGGRPSRGSTGLYHLAILYPTRADLAVSEALYLDDPDGNGVELYCDRAEKDWPRGPNGELMMFTKRLDLEKLLADHSAALGASADLPPQRSAT
jgi:catechol 2,3-dioxygenase